MGGALTVVDVLVEIDRDPLDDARDAGALGGALGGPCLVDSAEAALAQLGGDGHLALAHSALAAVEDFAMRQDPRNAENGHAADEGERLVDHVARFGVVEEADDED